MTGTVRLPRLPGEFATRPRFLALAAFLFAGDLKADPRLAWLPVDLTLLTGAVLCLVLARRWAGGARLRSAGTPALLGWWYLTFLPGALQAAPTAYALQKVGTIFSFTLLCSLAPLILVQEAEDLDRLVNAVACFCLAITLGGLLGGLHSDQAMQRLQAFGAGTISLGRAAGMLFLRAAAAIGEGRALPSAGFAVLAGIMAAAGVAGLFSGSRGPIVAALGALALLHALGRTRSGRGLGRLALAAGLFAGVLAAALPLAPRGSLGRVEAFLGGHYGGSEAYRVIALEESWRRVGETPWGLGWGGFATQVDPERGLGRQYPHNLLAETTLESGWLCGAATLLMVGAALACAWAGTLDSGGRLVFAGVLFYACNALVSGDLNDNRPLFTFISCALLAPRLARPRAAEALP
jgi:hypothetical protein